MVYCLTTIAILCGQESQLILTNKSNAKEHVIETGKKVTVYLSESSYVKGDLVLMDSTSISVGKDTIPLAEIFSIKARSKQTQTKGEILTGIGAAFILGGAIAMGTASQQKDESFDITSGVYEATGIGLFAIGGVITGAGIINLTTGKNFNRSKWDYSIRKVPDMKE